MTSLKAWATAPLRASAVPIPIPHDHEADLVDHAVGQHPAQVVLDDGVEDGEAGHDGADVDQELGARKAAGQGVDRHLGGEGATGTRCRSGWPRDRRR